MAAPVSEVLGLVRIPKIVIGAPSPEFEPRAIADGFRTFPFRPDTVVDGWSCAGMTVRGATLRGHFHRYNGAPRQDDFAIHQIPDGRVVALVADGVSQAPQSHLGSSTAVRYAAQWLHDNAPPASEDVDWLALVRSTAWALTEQAKVMHGLDEPDPGRAERDLATTLVCALIEPIKPETLRVFAIGVGDSGVWILRDGEFVPVLGGKSESEGGISSSAVAGLPRVPIELVPAVVELAVGEVLLLGTDGIGDPLGSGQGGVGNLLRELFENGTLPSLVEFANAVDFSRETFDDDRTLIAVLPRANVGDQTS